MKSSMLSSCNSFLGKSEISSNKCRVQLPHADSFPFLHAGNCNNNSDFCEMQ